MKVNETANRGDVGLEASRGQSIRAPRPGHARAAVNPARGRPGPRGSYTANPRASRPTSHRVDRAACRERGRGRSSKSLGAFEPRARDTMATRMTERQQLAIAMRESMASAPVVPVVPVVSMDGKENSPPRTVSARHRAARRAFDSKNSKHAPRDDGNAQRPRPSVSPSRPRPPTLARPELPTIVSRARTPVPDAPIAGR